MADVYLQHKRTCTVLRRKKSENKMRGGAHFSLFRYDRLFRRRRKGHKCPLSVYTLKCGKAW